MRRLLPFAVLAALLVPSAATARPGGLTDGTLSVKDGRGIITIQGRGGVIGSFAKGAVTINDPIDGDGTGPIVNGDDWSKERNDTTTTWGGTRVRFRMIGGTFKIVVDDEASIASFVSLYLRNAGYEVRTATNGADALASVQSQQPSLIVLDLMLPDIDGIEICRRIRQKSDVPILMLTARDEDVDKIIGLEVGADDYMTKPFNPRELVARVKSILRRAAP